MSEPVVICHPLYRLFAEGYLAGAHDESTQVVEREDCPPKRLFFMTTAQFERWLREAGED